MKHVIVAIFVVCGISATLQDDKDAKITLYENFNDGQGNFKYVFHTDNGITTEQIGRPKKINGKRSVVMSGLFSFVAPDKTFHEVRYTSDEDGYQPHFTIAAASSNTPKLKTSNSGSETPSKTVQPNVVLNQTALNMTGVASNNTNATDDRIGTPVLISLQSPG